MSSPFRRLLPYVRRHRRAVLVGLGCALGSTVFQLIAPWVLKLAIDDLQAGVTRSKLAIYALSLLALAVAGGLFRFGMRRIVIGASREMEYDLRNDFFAALQRFPVAYYQAHRTGDLMSRATNDLSAVRMMIGPAVMYSTTTIVMFVAAVALMLSLDVWLTGVALLVLPLVSVSVKLFGTAIHSRFERIQAQLSEMSAVAQEALAGVRVVRAYRQERAELERFRQANEEYVRRNRVLVRLQGAFYPSMTFFLGARGARRAVARQPRGDRRPPDRRRVRRVQLLRGDALVADDCLRLGHQHAPAGHGVVEAHARGDGHRAGDHGCGRVWRADRSRRRSGARSSFVT